MDRETEQGIAYLNEAKNVGLNGDYQKNLYSLLSIFDGNFLRSRTINFFSRFNIILFLINIRKSERGNNLECDIYGLVRCEHYFLSLV